MKSKLTLPLMFVIGLASLAVSAPPQVTAPDQPRYGGPGHQPYSYDPFGTQYVNQRSNVEESQLARQAEELLQQLPKAKSDVDKEKLMAILTEVLGKQFDLRQQRHTSQIEALEAEVKRLKKVVQTRQENRRDIIAKRLDQLLRDAEGLGW
jgi:hypothetical protein